jgi:hypothetical protein
MFCLWAGHVGAEFSGRILHSFCPVLVFSPSAGLALVLNQGSKGSPVKWLILPLLPAPCQPSSTHTVVRIVTQVPWIVCRQRCLLQCCGNIGFWLQRNLSALSAVSQTLFRQDGNSSFKQQAQLETKWAAASGRVTALQVPSGRTIFRL